MSYPKWKYRKHPSLGVFQATLVASAEADNELGSDWSDDPSSTGFAVRPAKQVHPSHFVKGLLLHEVVTDSESRPLPAVIEVITSGDASHG